MSYTGYYTELKNVHKDPNSDRLFLATCMEEGVIVDDKAYEGQRVFYFPADGCLDYDFAMKFGLMRKDKDGNPAGGYLDYPSCHIRAIKLRGNRSEGIAIDAQKVLDTYDDMTEFELGDKITHIAAMKSVRSMSLNVRTAAILQKPLTKAASKPASFIPTS